jgi:hypothetical protein
MDKKTHAPVALFAFNRPYHLRRTIESLKRCQGFAQTRIFLFADAARNPAEEEIVTATRSVAVELLGRDAELRFAHQNRGLSRSIIEGVSEIVERYGRVIVVEDDLLLGSSFLRYLNDALCFYADHPHVFQVSGHVFEVPEFARRRESLLLPLTTTWGWATWSRAWRAFDPQAEGWQLLASDSELRCRFNLDGSYDYAGMLNNQMQGRLDSWGIRWYWSVFKAGGLSCFPPRSLVANAGLDGTGTHGPGIFRHVERVNVSQDPVGFVPAPDGGCEPGVWTAVKRAIWRRNGGPLGRMTSIFKSLLVTPEVRS